MNCNNCISFAICKASVYEIKRELDTFSRILPNHLFIMYYRSIRIRCQESLKLPKTSNHYEVMTQYTKAIEFIAFNFDIYFNYDDMYKEIKLIKTILSNINLKEQTIIDVYKNYLCYLL